MKTFEFKKLELKQDANWFKRTIQSPHTKRTIVYSIIGVVIAYALFYFEQSGNNKVFWDSKALQYIITGLGIGIFITNSPCARGRC